MTDTGSLSAPTTDVDGSRLTQAVVNVAEAATAEPEDRTIDRAALRRAKVMIVDDEPINIHVVKRYLALEGYENFVTCSDSSEVMAAIGREQPDLLLLDIFMPRVSGIDILRQLQSELRRGRILVIVLTASNDKEIRKLALELGATDFLSKPLEPVELIPRIRNVVQLKQHHDRLRNYARDLENEVLRRTAELIRSRKEIIRCLAQVAEFRNDGMGHHVTRVGRYARLIARALGWQGEALDVLEQAAQLHDVGKIGLPDATLERNQPATAGNAKPTNAPASAAWLAAHDSDAFPLHTQLGSRLLSTVESPILATAAVISLYHHEHWDGSGYPEGLCGEQIPIEARITAVADVFDTLSTKGSRDHHAAAPLGSLNLDQCFQILEAGRGKYFDPAVLDAFFDCRQEILFVRLEYADA
ncbi:MAG TPA: HD domain-containing phosphohydrolase [Pirellulales bacterium]|jgi:putative two-component system response regulator|nr:HD domain-containing phosphohydrolase [Pirellulales bacterium]